MSLDNNAPKGWKNLDDFREGLQTNLQPISKELNGTSQTYIKTQKSINARVVHIWNLSKADIYFEQFTDTGLFNKTIS